MKNILIISSSPRKKGNSQILCEQFKKGAEAKGHQVKIVRIMEQNIGFCRACDGCMRNGGTCVLKDDMVIQVVNKDLFSLFDKYCKIIDIQVERTLNYHEDNYDIKEKYIEIDNLKIKYFETENSAFCNFIKNETSDDLEILKVINYLKNKNKLSFITDVQNLDYLLSLGFKIECKDYKLG